MRLIEHPLAGRGKPATSYCHSRGTPPRAFCRAQSAAAQVAREDNETRKRAMQRECLRSLREGLRG